MRSAKRKLYFPNSIVFVPCLVNCERFPLEVRIIFQKKQMLRALRELWKHRAAVVVNYKKTKYGRREKVKVW